VPATLIKPRGVNFLKVRDPVLESCDRRFASPRQDIDVRRPMMGSCGETLSLVALKVQPRPVYIERCLALRRCW
jgi:hypothetical protein